MNYRKSTLEDSRFDIPSIALFLVIACWSENDPNCPVRSYAESIVYGHGAVVNNVLYTVSPETIECDGENVATVRLDRRSNALNDSLPQEVTTINFPFKELHVLDITIKVSG